MKSIYKIIILSVLGTAVFIFAFGSLYVMNVRQKAQMEDSLEQQKMQIEKLLEQQKRDQLSDLNIIEDQKREITRLKQVVEELSKAFMDQ